MKIREFLDEMNNLLDQMITAYEDMPEDEEVVEDVEGSTETASEEIVDDVDQEDGEESNLFSAYKELEDQILSAVEALGEEVEVTVSVVSVEIVDGLVSATVNVNGEEQVFTA